MTYNRYFVSYWYVFLNDSIRTKTYCNQFLLLLDTMDTEDVNRSIKAIEGLGDTAVFIHITSINIIRSFS